MKSVDDLMDSYENAVGHGGQWMLGVAPDDRGLLPDSDAARLRELGLGRFNCFLWMGQQSSLLILQNEILWRQES